MTDLVDYSGPILEGELTPQESMMRFSKETLADVLHDLCKLYVRLSGDYENCIARRWGWDEVHPITLEAWQAHDPLAYRWLFRKRFRLHESESDVEAFLKWQQIHPAVGGLYPTKVEMKGHNYGVFTIIKCRSLEYWERIGDNNKIKVICSECGTDWASWQYAAEMINPNMKVTALKVPPRRTEEDIACQWEVSLEH
ncbi:hypothetical protein [Neptuniibacter sp.]|uniref:hypothetical protein n=1 Tax=Neptuniibacter sp. TaxID=1962643 RepID=UPI0026287197|nr:hypothetical protein [Neptuniibacter sp.]MCP4595985.1 hypothetical protein [Neptuniibacter sp.]